MGIKLKGKKCERCGTDDYSILTRHRIVPGGGGGTHHPDNVKILCKNCHDLTHLESQTEKVNIPIVIKHSEKYVADRYTGLALSYKTWIYPLNWYKLESDDKKGLWVGICGLSKKVFDFEASSPLVDILLLRVDDVIISEEDGCEFKSRCLVTKCKHNKTTFESYAESRRLTERDFVWLKENWNRTTNLRPVRALCRSLGISPHR